MTTDLLYGELKVDSVPEFVEVTMTELLRDDWLSTAKAAEDTSRALMAQGKMMRLVFTEENYRFNNGDVWDVCNYLHKSYRPFALAHEAVIRRDGYEKIVKAIDPDRRETFRRMDRMMAA